MPLTTSASCICNKLCLLNVPVFNTDMLLAALTLLLLVFLFFISGAEVALFTLNYKDISMLKTKQHAAAKRIVTFLDNPKSLLGSLTIANIILTIGIVILSNYIIGHYVNIQNSMWIGVFFVKMLVIVLLLLFIGNILPKVWASQNPLGFAINASYIVEIIFLLFGNISKPLIRVSDKFNRQFIKNNKEQQDGVLLDYAIDKLPENEANTKEKQMLKGIHKFGNTTVKQIKKQRLDVNGLEYTSNFATVLQLAQALHYSRLPVYSNTLDDMRGMLYTKDLLPHLHENETFDWNALIKPCVFVHEHKLIEDLLQEFRTKHIHIAVVVDEFGGTSGIVTLEDILEEIVGEIKDEFDDDDLTEYKVNDTTYIFEGKTMLNDVCRILNIANDTFDTHRGDSDSLGGLVLELAEDIPTVQQVILCKNFEFTVLEMEKNRIKKIQLHLIT